MIGRLPTALEICGSEWEIRTDFRDILLICEALEDPELNDQEKAEVMLVILFPDFDQMEKSMYREALEKAAWFIDCGRRDEERGRTPKTFDWEQDEQMILSAVNKVAGYEVRALEYLHWWSFCGYFLEIEGGLFSTVLGIRQKRAKGKKLEKWEQEFYRNNKQLCDLKKRYTEEEQAEIDYWNKLLG